MYWCAVDDQVGRCVRGTGYYCGHGVSGDWYSVYLREPAGDHFIPELRGTLENDWAGNIYAYRPYWVVPRSDGDAVRWFYEGVTQGTIYSPRCLDRAALLVAELDPDGVLCLLLSGGDLSPAVGRKRATGLSAD